MVEELARFLLMWVGLLGSAVAFRVKGHLGVDFLVINLTRLLKMMMVFVQVMVLLFAVTILLYGGAKVVLDALTMEQVTPALGWKMGYVYLALPVSGFFTVVYTIDNLLQALREDAEEE